MLKRPTSSKRATQLGAGWPVATWGWNRTWPAWVLASNCWQAFISAGLRGLLLSFFMTFIWTISSFEIWCC